MTVSISMPARIQAHLESGWGDGLTRKIQEAIAVEGYHSGVLSLGEVSELLEISINDADGLLKDRGISVVDDLAELERDSAVLEELLTR